MNTINETNFQFPNQKSVYKGKVRDDFSPKNKAIKAVAKNLKKAKDNILEYLPELKELLKDVKTGNLFGYIPSNPDKPIKIIIEQ